MILRSWCARRENTRTRACTHAPPAPEIHTDVHVVKYSHFPLIAQVWVCLIHSSEIGNASFRSRRRRGRGEARRRGGPDRGVNTAEGWGGSGALRMSSSGFTSRHHPGSFSLPRPGGIYGSSIKSAAEYCYKIYRSFSSRFTRRILNQDIHLSMTLLKDRKELVKNQD